MTLKNKPNFERFKRRTISFILKFIRHLAILFWNQNAKWVQISSIFDVLDAWVFLKPQKYRMCVIYMHMCVYMCMFACEIGET